MKTTGKHAVIIACVALRCLFAALSTLQILFVCLKAFDVVSWSWWTVFIPSMVEVCVAFIVSGMAFQTAVISVLDKIFLGETGSDDLKPGENER